MKTLNTPFNHKNWFVKRNPETNQYEPYLTKKIALQYFASSGDFYDDNGVLRYSGKEKGSYRMNQEEKQYFQNLLIEKQEAKEESKKYIQELKNKLSEANPKQEIKFIFKNTFVSVSVWLNSDYVSTDVNFTEYILENGGETKKSLQELLN